MGKSARQGIGKTAQLVAKYLGEKSDPWTDLGLTLPLFVGYHLGVVFLPVRNAADFVTVGLVKLVNFSILAYTGLTLGLATALIAVLVILGRGKKLVAKRFLFVILEGAVYAMLMAWAANHIVGSLRLGSGIGHGFFSGLIMSLGAGFYEEIAFRVVLFGLGLHLIQRILKKRDARFTVGWALITAFLFSAWHHVGPYGDPVFPLTPFFFRWTCGVILVAIYHHRGFAPAVWCHALYDIWVLAL